MAHAAIVAALAAASAGLGTRFDAPPRFDGAGYAVLARSLLGGSGYRAIDHPDRPRHAHFPPGYPLALAATWGLAGPSPRAAHALSLACTVAATVGFWAWFRRLYRPGTALALGLALAVNWAWARSGGAIQSEPLFVLLEALALLAAARAEGAGLGLVLGLILGAAILTRHVGACLALAVGLDLVAQRRLLPAASAALAAALVVLPWAAWLAVGREPNQLGLLPRDGLALTVANNALFYLRRLPDLVTGPVVEVGTVFRPALKAPMTAWAVVATGLIVGGWLRTLRGGRRRLAGLVPLLTLALLLAWPFTEAGRFLIPLLPFVLVGAVEGVGPIAARPGWRRPRARAAAAVLALSIPYTAYALATGRAVAAERRHADFDAACAWIAAHADRPGPVLSRHPGEVFLQAGRPALPVPADGLDAIERLIARYGVAYLLIDDDRFARAEASPLGRFVRARLGRVARVNSRSGSVAVYEVAGGAP